MLQPVVYLTTCDKQETADEIASQLVEQRFAACVNVVSPAKSTYRWEGKVTTAQEWLLIIKTVRKHHDDILDLLRKLSGYDLPEFIALDITGGSTKYLQWVIAQT